MNLLTRSTIARISIFLIVGTLMLAIAMWPESNYMFDIGTVEPPHSMGESFYLPEQSNNRTFQQTKPTIPLWLPISNKNLELNLVLAGNTVTPTLFQLKFNNQIEINALASQEFRSYHILVPNEMILTNLSLSTTPFTESISSGRTLGVAVDFFSIKILDNTITINPASWPTNIGSRMIVLLALWFLGSFLVSLKKVYWFLAANSTLIVISRIYSLYFFNIVVAIALATSAIALLVIVLTKAIGRSRTGEKSYPFPNNSFIYPYLELVFWAIVTCLMTYPLITQLNDVFPDKLDSYLNSWILAWDHHQLWRDPLHLFETNIIRPYPYTLAQSEHLLGLYPITGPLFLLGLPPAAVHNLTILIGFGLCGFGMSQLTRLVTGSRVAGIVAGLIYAFYPYRMVQMGHIQQMSAQWMPLTFWALEKFRQRQSWRYAGLSGLFFLLQSLISYYHAIFLGVMVVVYGLYFIVRDERLRARKPLAKLLIVGVLIIGIHLPLARPYLYLQKHLGFQRNSADSVQYSAALTDYLSPNGFNDFYVDQVEFLGKIAPIQSVPQSYLTRWQFISDRPTHETVLFVGIIPLVFMAIGIAQWRKNKLVQCMTLIVAACVVLSFGPVLRFDWSGNALFSDMPYKYALIDRVVRAPARFALGGIVGFAVLAGFGVARLSQWLRVHYDRAWLIFNLCVIVLVPLELHRPVNFYPIIKPNTGVEAWLDEHPSGLTVSVPTGVLEQDSRYEFYSTRHFNPIMNGYSGYYNLPTYHAFLNMAEPVPDPLTLRMLQGIGLKYFVTHTSDWSDDERMEAAKRLPAIPQLQQVARFGQSVIYDLSPDPWMEEIEPFVAGKTLYISDGGTLPHPYADLLALRFHTSVVAGRGLLGYQQLEPPPPGNLPDYGLFGVNENPVPVGFNTADIVWQNDLFKLIKRP